MISFNRDEFIAAWQSATSRREVAAATGRTIQEIDNLARALRREGVPLKKFQPGRRPTPMLESDAPYARAGRAAHDEGLSFAQAAARFGISRQAVHIAYRAMFPDAPRRGGQGGHDEIAHGVVRELAQCGLPDDAIAADTGYCEQTVARIRLAANINRKEQEEAAFALAIESVRGGARALDAAADFTVGYATLIRRCRDAGIPLNGRPGIRTGANSVGADLVESGGMTIVEAARAVGCAASGVACALRRRRARAGEDSLDERATMRDQAS